MIVAHHFEVPMCLVTMPPYTRAALCAARVYDPEDTETSPVVWHYAPVILEGRPITFDLPFPQGDPTDHEDIYDALLGLLPQAAERFRALTDLVIMAHNDISPEQITGEEPPRR